ncbi:MAG: hypothetical protein GY711_14825 [bacterium]|nr:hypothetical protein [bacterium]
MMILTLLSTLPLLGPAVSAAPTAPRYAPAACQDGLPLVYRGDGMTATITAIEESTGAVSGTIQLDGGTSMSFALSLDDSGRGRGTVTTAKGEKKLSSRDVDDTTVRVTFRAKRYTLVLGAAPEPEPKPEPTSERATNDARTAAPTGPITLVQHTFQDKGMGGMNSHTMLIPKGWKAEGGAFWLPQQFFSVLPSQDIRVTSPDGVSVQIEPMITAKEILPPAELGLAPPARGSADKGFPIIPLPDDIDAWKRWVQDEVVAAGSPGATKIRVLDGAVIPELTWELKRQHAPYKKMLEQGNGMGMGSHTTADCAVLGFESTFELNGVQYEELRVLALTYTIMDAQYTGRMKMWGVERAVTYRAPKGQLNAHMPVLKAVADSVRMTPEWFRMRADLHAKLMKISREVARSNMEAARKRSEIIAQSGRELNEIITSGYRERDAIRSASHDKVIHAIRGTEEYITPGSDTAVHLPFGYDHVYSNARGEFLLTNDSLFEPNVDSSTNDVDWTRMQVSR